MREGQRPPLPADPSTLSGGTFPGLPAYLELMQACWAQDPSARPPFAVVARTLRELAAALAGRGGGPAGTPGA